MVVSSNENTCYQKIIQSNHACQTEIPHWIIIRFVSNGRKPPVIKETADSLGKAK